MWTFCLGRGNNSRAGKFIWMNSNQQTSDNPYSQDLRVKQAKKKSNVIYNSFMNKVDVDNTSQKFKK